MTPNTTPLSAARLALAARDARTRNTQPELQRSEPLAIVGMGCRLPGSVGSPEEFFRLLRSGTDAITEIPSDRWKADAFFDPDFRTAGKMNTRWGGFIENVDRFDPVLFGIAPREACSMDPQQRLLLEVVWEALDDAGMPLGALAGTDTGVFVAIYNSDYGRQLHQQADSIGSHTCAGAAHSIASGRVSYLLDLHGPCMSVDTACSSSLVAVQRACQSLRGGECHIAIVGGVTVHGTPEHFISLAKLGMLSPDGRCKTFDAGANGFVPGEGCGVVVIKRLADALADGDRVHAVIRGAAINHDGRTNVLTAPNGLAHRALIRAALDNAQVPADAIGYVETHGTGTALGDPIEVEALAEVIGGPGGGEPCVLGAVKSNIGHLEAAAGIAGLIKAVLVLEHGEIPPNLHFQSLNPHISLEGTRLVLPTESRPWPRGDRLRFVGVSSFGFGGTNAHIILEEAPRIPTGAAADTNPHVLLLSARTPDALRAAVSSYDGFLGSTGAVNAYRDICFTSAEKRTHYEERLALIAGSHEEARARLAEYRSGNRGLGISTGRAERDPGPIAFVCSGQGSQWPRMGMELFGAEAVYRASVEQCDALVQKRAGWSLVAHLAESQDRSELRHTEYAQPAIFAVEVALSRLLIAWGIRPDLILGHSGGEIAAAHLSGALSLEDAVSLVVLRGQLMEKATGKGRMAVVQMESREVERRIARFGGRVSLAAANSPGSCTVSGDPEEIAHLMDEWLTAGVSCKLMPVDYAFHSAQMQPFSEALEQQLGKVERYPMDLGMLSTVTGRRIGGAELDAAYWGRNIRKPVLFSAAITSALEEGIRTFVEIGPHTVLTGSIGECIAAAGSDAKAVPSLRRHQHDRLALLRSLGNLHCMGHKIDWSAVFGNTGRSVSLPPYPYQRQRYWIETPREKNATSERWRKLDSPAMSGTAFEAEVGPCSDPSLNDHKIRGRVLLPMSAFLTYAAATAERFYGKTRALTGVAISQPLYLSAHQDTLLQIVFNGDAFRIYSRVGNEWRQHATGMTARASAPAAGSAPTTVGSTISCEEFYALLRERGIEFGPRFRTVSAVSRGEGYAQATVSRTAEGGEDWPPEMLDGCLQPASRLEQMEDHVYLPIGADRFEIFGRAGDTVWSTVSVRNTGQKGRNLCVDVSVRSAGGSELARVEGLLLRRVSADPAGALYQLNWTRQKRQGAAPAIRSCLMVATPRSDGALGLATRLRGRGIAVTFAEGGGETPLDNWSGYDSVVAFVETATTEPLAGVSEAGPRVLAAAQRLMAVTGSKKPRFWVIAKGIGAAAFSGLVLTANLEDPAFAGTHVDIDDSDESMAAVAEEIAYGTNQDRLRFLNGDRHVARLEPTAVGYEPCHLTIEKRGSLDNLVVVGCDRRAPEPDEVEIEVETSALNFRDVLNALGAYPGDAGPLGLEFCGRVKRAGPRVRHVHSGDHVMGIAWGSFSSYVTTPAALVVRVPDGLTSQEAVTLPNAFLTARYCLETVGGLQCGERVLIHAASGGVGLAAVQIAQRIGAEIFATAGDEVKREYLRSLGIRHVFDSRSPDFAGQIHQATGGEGIDLVLNSLTGPLIKATISALRRGARFVEIGKKGIWTTGQMEAADKAIFYSVVDLAKVIDNSPEQIQAALVELAVDVAGARLKPLPHIRFRFSEAVAAFRYMAQARHIGKIVLDHHSCGITVRPDRTYLITGGVGALGMQGAEWLIARGARHLVLASRSAPTGEVSQRIDDLRTTGARIEVRQCDVSREAEAQTLVDSPGREMPPLGGVLHAAGALDDGILARQSWSRFELALSGKARGAWNLHRATERLPIDWFILFSSMASITGGAGQANYAAANSFLDALAVWRVGKGLPALSVNWGAWAGVGMAARTESQGHRAMTMLKPMLPALCLEALELAAAHGPLCAIADFEWNDWKSAVPPVFESLATRHAAPTVTPVTAISIVEQLQRTPEAGRRTLMVNFLRAQAARILGLTDAAVIDQRQPLIQMGLDSLMAIEFRNRLMEAFTTPLSATLLFDYPTVAALADYLGGTQPAAAANGDGLLETVRHLTDEEAEALLERELDSA